MKVSKKLLILLLLLSFSKAQALICRAQVIHTMCSSGKIEFSLDETTSKFTFYKGDALCWLGDRSFRGSVAEKEQVFPYYLGDAYNLKFKNSFGDLAMQGEFLYNSEEKVAKLNFTEGRVKDSYDLVCEE